MIIIKLNTVIAIDSQVFTLLFEDLYESYIFKGHSIIYIEQTFQKKSRQAQICYLFTKRTDCLFF